LEYQNVQILGGCCGTTPEHIEELKKQTFNKISKNL
jgi:methionine synthase I (cobalamin-dependent)